MDRDPQATWEQYVGAWKMKGASEKAARLMECLDPRCVYRDPLAEAHGREALVDYMLRFHQQVPGGYFVTKTFVIHHGRGLATWDMCDGEDRVIGDGTSYCEFGRDGKLTSMAGFFEVSG